MNFIKELLSYLEYATFNRCPKVSDFTNSMEQNP